MSQNTHNRPLTRASVIKAHERIKPYIHETPVLTSHNLSQLASVPQTIEAITQAAEERRRDGVIDKYDSMAMNDENQMTVRPARPRMNLFFKSENQQRVGAFKARGAFHALGRLMTGELEGGVITHSSGNHAAALALAAKTRKIPAHIVMPTISTPSKIAATRSHGAMIYFSGSTAPEREAVVREVQAETGAVLVPPYDHVDIVLGQGTAALEFEAQVKSLISNSEGYPEAYQSNMSSMNSHDRTVDEFPPSSEGLDCVLVPCGGGGLLSGTATALSNTGIAVFGTEPTKDGADDCRRGLASSPPKRIPHVSTLTIADGVRTPVGEIPWSVISDPTKVKDVYAVSEGQIVEAMRLILERLKVVVEPSAAIPFAVALFDEGFRSWVEKMSEAAGGAKVNVGIVLSGGNTTVDVLAGLFGKGNEEGVEKEDKVGLERAKGTQGVNRERVAEDVAG